MTEHTQTRSHTRALIHVCLCVLTKVQTDEPARQDSPVCAKSSVDSVGRRTLGCRAVSLTCCKHTYLHIFTCTCIANSCRHLLALIIVSYSQKCRCCCYYYFDWCCCCTGFNAPLWMLNVLGKPKKCEKTANGKSQKTNRFFYTCGCCYRNFNCRRKLVAAWHFIFSPTPPSYNNNNSSSSNRLVACAFILAAHYPHIVLGTPATAPTHPPSLTLRHTHISTTCATLHVH